MKSAKNTVENLTNLDPDDFELSTDDEALSSTHITAGESGVTPIQRQNIDDSRIDELLIEDGISEEHYPTINDIADPDAVKLSFDE